MAPSRVQSCNPGVVLTVLIEKRGSYARGSNWEGNWKENSDPLVEKCNSFHKYSSGQRGWRRGPFFLDVYQCSFAGAHICWVFIVAT